MGMFMLAPVLYTFGSAEQCHRFLPGILDNSVEWCQGYSEPEAGSYLAALRTRSSPQDDHYVVNGEKTWTSYAHVADWMFCIVRTDSTGRRQDGITFLLIDMRSPGVSVQPIVTLDGRHSTLNSVTFTNVRVPVDHRVGEGRPGLALRQGLADTRAHGPADAADSTRRLRRLRQTAARTPTGRGCLLDDPLFAARLAEVEFDLMALEITELRTLAETASGQAPGTQSSILKPQGTRASTADGTLRRVRRPAGAALQLRRVWPARGDQHLPHGPLGQHRRRHERGAARHHRQTCSGLPAAVTPPCGHATPTTASRLSPPRRTGGSAAPGGGLPTTPATKPETSR